MVHTLRLVLGVWASAHTLGVWASAHTLEVWASAHTLGAWASAQAHHQQWIYRVLMVHLAGKPSAQRVGRSPHLQPRPQQGREWLMLLRLVLPALLILCLTGCRIEDERDCCCCGGPVLLLQHHIDGREILRQVVEQVQAIAVSTTGQVEILDASPDGDIAHLSLVPLTPGTWTITTTGNPDGEHRYWGESQVVIGTDRQQTYVQELSNVHCHLRVRVEWEGVPPYSSGYAYQLQQVGDAMEQHDTHDDRMLTIRDQRFPPVTSWNGTATVPATLRRFALDETITTMRYTWGHFPVFTLLHDGQPATPPIDLGKAFHKWDWWVDQDPVQDYTIRLLVHRDGTIEAFPNLEGHVNDWQEGENFS